MWILRSPPTSRYFVGGRVLQLARRHHRFDSSDPLRSPCRPELVDDMAPSSPECSTKSEDWYTPPSSLGLSDSDSEHWSTISNAPSAESQSENVRAADYELKGKTKASRHISGTPTSGVDMVNAVQMELVWLTPGVPRAVSTRKFLL